MFHPETLVQDYIHLSMNYIDFMYLGLIQVYIFITA